MYMNKRILLLICVIVLFLPAFGQERWTLRECLDYALEHNIQLQTNKLQEESASEDVLSSRAQLYPSATFSTGQNISYRPFPEGGGTTVTNGYVDTEVNKTTYNGTYTIGANWTVWDGGKSRYALKQSHLSEEQASLSVQQTANSIEEQITQLYVQILYNTESIAVYEEIVGISRSNLERGKAMLEVGTMSRADVAQLEAQLAQDEYNLVNATGQTARYKLQLKQLLEIAGPEEFDIAIPDASDDDAMALVPNLVDTYSYAVGVRPEVKSAQIAIQAAEIQEKSARAGYQPTIGLNASVSASTTSASDNSWGHQMKSNLSAGAGLNLSVPLYEQRNAKTAIRKAKIQQQESALELQEVEQTLWATIEGYWLDATTNQARFLASQASVASAEESFTLVSERFNEGLANIEELTNGKSTLITAEQNRLESKYMAILSLQMMRFYNGEEITL